MTPYRWTYLDEGGQPYQPESAAHTGFPNQADAEAWIGEFWQELAEDGVDSVVLWRDEEEVYGPMSLKPMS